MIKTGIMNLSFYQIVYLKYKSRANSYFPTQLNDIYSYEVLKMIDF
jgi:hypothetical protein